MKHLKNFSNDGNSEILKTGAIEQAIVKVNKIIIQY